MQPSKTLAKPPVLFPSVFPVNFSYFTKAQLDKLFAKDIEDRKDRAGKMRSKKKQDSEQESLKSDYVIENVQSLDNENVVLFCSRMYNYSVTTCDSKGNCTTRYYCQKSNVTAFKVGKEGSIGWASNLDRMKTYNGWNIYDVNVINEKNKFYVIYGSDYMAAAGKKKGSTRKKKEQRLDRLEYAVFDYGDGSFEKKEYKINAINAKKAQKKTISPTNIDVYDNKFYTTSLRTTYKPGQTALACLGCLICPIGAALTYPMWLGSIQRGYGFVGNIAPTK